MSQAENPELLAPGHELTPVRNRIRRLIEPLPPEHPARLEGERRIAKLEELAQHSGDPRGTLGIGH